MSPCPVRSIVHTAANKSRVVLSPVCRHARPAVGLCAAVLPACFARFLPPVTVQTLCVRRLSPRRGPRILPRAHVWRVSLKKQNVETTFRSSPDVLQISRLTCADAVRRRGHLL